MGVSIGSGGCAGAVQPTPRAASSSAAARTRPSMAQVRAAVRMHNTLSKNPSLVNSNPVAKQKLEEALKILEQDRAYTSLMGGRVKDAYVQPVKRIPDDLIKENGFNFNWKSAYENTKGEKLRDTEADYDKLQKFIESNMYKEGDPNVNLQKIAYDMHMYNPNTMKWADFINSEQGEEFKKYIKDVEKNQRTARIKDIFDNESNWLVDFTLPVSKEYAKQQLLEGKDPEMGLPILTDQVANALMFGGSKPAMVAAPVVKNAGDYAFNNVDPAVAGINTMLGVGTNIMTPYMIQRGGKYFTKPGETYSTKVKLQERVDQIADRVAKLQDKTRKGALFTFRNESGDVVGYGSNIKKIAYTDDGNAALNLVNKGYTIKPLRDMPKHKAGVLSDEEVKYIEQNQDILRQLNRSDSKTAQTMRERKYKAAHSKYAQKYIKEAYDKYVQNGGKFNNFELNELYSLGYDPMKESFGQFVWRTIPDVAKNYTTTSS